MTGEVRIEHLSRRFGNVVALDDVSLRLNPGEIRAIIGPNGAGKTTLVNVLTGFLPASAGRVHLGDERIDLLSVHERARRGLRRTFQRPQICIELSVRDNIAIGGHARPGASLAESRREAADLAATVGLAGSEDRLARTLPYGGLRLVEIARALMGRPRFLLLDEPVAGMNPAEREHVAGVIRRIRDGGVGVVVIEHDMPFVMGLCERVSVLVSGSLLAEGTPAEIRADPFVQEVYLGAHREVGMASAIAAGSGRPLLEVDGLVTGYGALEIVHGLDLALSEGETLAVIGANGAGKTTTLQALVGQLPPWGGRVVLDGEDIAGRHAHEIARRGIALVPEGRRVFADLTVEENLRVGAHARRNGVPIRGELDRVQALFPVLRERKDQLAGSLSGGEQQMLAIGRALMGRPRLLLLDEPSMGLAPIMVDRVFERIVEIQRQGASILLVEQNGRLALQVSERVQVMQRGEIVLSGSSRDMARDPKLVDVYLGTELRESAAG